MIIAVPMPLQGGPSDVADRAGAAAGGHAAARDAGAVLRDGLGAGRAEGQRGLRQTQPRQDVQVSRGKLSVSLKVEHLGPIGPASKLKCYCVESQPCRVYGYLNVKGKRKL